MNLSWPWTLAAICVLLFLGARAWAGGIPANDVLKYSGTLEDADGKALTGKRFIEVKGREAGADTVTVTKNEILYSLNKPDEFILAMVEFLDQERHKVHYLRRPFRREPDFGVTSVNYDFGELLARAEVPR